MHENERNWTERGGVPTALFTKPPAEPFPALPGTIPEIAMKPSMGNGL